MNKIIDTHCHYNLKPLYSNYKKYIAKAEEVGVEASVCVGTSVETTQRALDIASSESNIFASCGIHPSNCQKLIESKGNIEEVNLTECIEQITAQFSQLEAIVKEHIDAGKIVAIGEVGLDFYRLKKKGTKRELVERLQKHLLHKQLELAISTNLPVILHVRDQEGRKNNAYTEVAKILKNLLQLSPQNKFPKIILHCASGPVDYIAECISMGAYIGIAGNVTYPNADNVRKIISVTPPDRLLLETDAPYLTPSGAKTEFCNPKDIVLTADYLHRTLEINLDIIRKNTFKVFPKLKKS